MLSDDRYLAGETSGIAPRHIPFLPGDGKESMPAVRQRGENRKIFWQFVVNLNIFQSLNMNLDSGGLDRTRIACLHPTVHFSRVSAAMDTEFKTKPEARWNHEINTSR
jgi:hypothetical protein